MLLTLRVLQHGKSCLGLRWQWLQWYWADAPLAGLGHEE
jgi:hypothetical protein